MKAKRAAAGAACILACALAGCTPGRILDQFDDPDPKVTLACGEAYKIYEKQQPRRLVVASSSFRRSPETPAKGLKNCSSTNASPRSRKTTSPARAGGTARSPASTRSR